MFTTPAFNTHKFSTPTVIIIYLSIYYFMYSSTKTHLWHIRLDVITL